MMRYEITTTYREIDEGVCRIAVEADTKEEAIAIIKSGDICEWELMDIQSQHTEAFDVDTDNIECIKEHP
jgi:predicted class III extradiol MEMO1 family dioxygenase